MLEGWNCELFVVELVHNFVLYFSVEYVVWLFFVIAAMSSMTSVFVRPAGSVQGVEICSCVLPVSISRWKDRRLCPGGVGVMGVFDGGRRRMVVQAGLGRYSGAIHGSRSKKSWRRNPSQISEDERNEKELVRDLQFV